jgi:hypothetical protein
MRETADEVNMLIPSIELISKCECLIYFGETDNLGSIDSWTEKEQKSRLIFAESADQNRQKRQFRRASHANSNELKRKRF